MQHHAFQRTTLLEELQSILHEYPDNEQIIKELLQNAEDAEARVVKMGFCPSSNSDDLPAPYKKYLSGPALCFYNDSVFKEEDWTGITMVRKSNKQDDPLKVGKFGIGFKSVFHITDTVCVISGRNILFIDPLYELQDPKKVCYFGLIADYVKEEACGPKGLEPLYNLFGINEDLLRSGEYKGSLFWFPLRTSPSELSENRYTSEKVTALLESFKEKISSELLFLTSIEEIEVYKMERNNCEVECKVTLDHSSVEKIRNQRKEYKTKIKDIDEKMTCGDLLMKHCNPVWMKDIVTLKVTTDEVERNEIWFITHYFHAGNMTRSLSRLITNQRSRYRPHIGVAARLDHHIQSGQLFCFLPLPFQDESPTGLPVHINGLFALESNRQHIKWPTHDQEAENLNLENDMQWNVLLVQEILPLVYKEFLNSWQGDGIGLHLAENYLEMFYFYIPRLSKAKTNWGHVAKMIDQHLHQSKIPCLESRKWIQTHEAYFAIFPENIHQNIQNTVRCLFQKCTQKVVILKEHKDLFHHWSEMNPYLKFTNPKETRDLLRMDNTYKQFDSSSKEHLLIYVCCDQILSDLNGIELLPLQNKLYETFHLKEEEFGKTVYLCREEELEILIGREDSLTMSTTSDLGKVLESLALAECYTFKKLKPRMFLQLLKETVSKEEEKVGVPMFFRDSSAIFGELWLKKLWRYLEDYPYLSLDSVRDLCIVKTIESNVLKKISDSFISEVVMFSHIKILQYFKIWIVDTKFHDSPLLEPGKGIVVECTDEGKGILLKRCIQNGIKSFNALSSVTEREWFKEFLPDTIPTSVITMLESLKIFKCFSSTIHQIGYTSLRECREVYVGDTDFPIPFPNCMILSTTKKEKELLSKLSARNVSLTDCVKRCIEEIIEKFHQMDEGSERRFCFYVLEKQPLLRDWWKIQRDLNSIRFIKNRMGNLCSAETLYDPSDHLLKELFLQEDKFPEEKKGEMDLLKHLHFLNRNSQTFKNDIVRTCQIIHSKKLSIVSRKTKSNALIWVFRQIPNLFDSVLNSIYEYKILPFKLKPEENENYPKSMKWYSENEELVSLKMVYSSHFQYVIGSILPTPSGKWEEQVSVNKKPPLKAVIDHFHEVTNYYCEDEHTSYSYIMKKLYLYLAEENIANFASSLPEKCILTEVGFVKANDVYLERRKSDIDVAPYFVPLPKEYAGLENIFYSLGCHKNQCNDLLVETLTKIKEKHCKLGSSDDINQDLVKVEKILRRLSEIPNEELSLLRDKIVLPIHNGGSSILTFRPLNECAYSDLDWFSRTFTDEDDICIIHSKIDKQIAKNLGVKSLKKFTLSDAEEIYSEFGQSEPLTLRLHHLLEEGYTDGLSVPKELIQNADDAGATEINFLYDERENEDTKSCLLDTEMQSCQGPALWTFNNANFTSSDFENIQKISAASKKGDTTKIGKFGLGFNAVYNLTDIPSFASGQYLVYLDPHKKFIGNAISNNRSPGIKLNLHNKIMLQKFENQFKPFQNVFGFNSSKLMAGELYNGTLFRFPLRTKKQAITSEISNKVYSRSEMEKLIKLFCKTCGNMLIFTQNVKTIKIFHLNKECSDPDQSKLILEVHKKEDHSDKLESVDKNILAAASRHCKSMNESSSFLFTCKTVISLQSDGHQWLEKICPFKEEAHWLVTWALGTHQSVNLFRENKSDGSIPISSVAIPVDVKNGRVLPLSLCTDTQSFTRYGFYQRSHLFCFLPLPIQTPLNFHINGSFALSSDRQRLLMGSEDDKQNTVQSVWNTSLVTDATLEAILQQLVSLKNIVQEDYSCFQIWPKQTNDSFCSLLKHEFYKAIAQRNLPLLKTHCGWRKFKECNFLHSEIQLDEILKQTAFEFLREHPLDEKIITEIPKDVYTQFESCVGLEFSEQVVTYERFMVQCFLPNVSSMCGENYDYIILGALRSNNEIILDALKETDCITTCSLGKRLPPKHLVHPQSAVAKLFLPANERFPCEVFSEGDLEVLVKLGMMKSEIPFQILEDQTRDVKKLSMRCRLCAFERSGEIIVIYSSFV